MSNFQEEYPLVSVVVACYNHEKYVEETLDSILEDDYPNKEIVIINDGSSDRSDEIIQKWMDRNRSSIQIKYRYRANVGVCKTINELVHFSKGKYIVPVPSDDLLVAGSIKPRVKFLLEHPDKLVLISDANVIDENSKLIMQSSIEEYNKGDKNRFANDDSLLLSTLVSAQISGPTVMIDRRIYDIIGMYKENLMAEDWYFYQRAAAKKLMIYVDIVSGKYRVHSANTSGIKMRKSTKLAHTIILTYWYNWILMPGIKYKSIALMELLKWVLRYLIYRIKPE